MLYLRMIPSASMRLIRLQQVVAESFTVSPMSCRERLESVISSRRIARSNLSKLAVPSAGESLFLGGFLVVFMGSACKCVTHSAASRLLGIKRVAPATASYRRGHLHRPSDCATRCARERCLPASRDRSPGWSREHAPPRELATGSGNQVQPVPCERSRGIP